MAEVSPKIFISYSHEDEPLKNELIKHLSILKRQGVISIWQDRKISPGTEWDKEIKDNLQTADIILLLVSPDFIASEYCNGVEVKIAIERHNAGDARVIPVILRNVFWQLDHFVKLQALPTNATPVKSWTNQDDAFTDIAQGIRKVAQELIRKRQEEQARANKASALAQYRQKVEEFAADGEISMAESFILQDEQKKLGLTDQEVEKIREQVLEPYGIYKENLDKYRQFFTQLVKAQGYPLGAKGKAELRTVQKHYNLKDEDIAHIEQEQEVIEQEQPQPKIQSFDFDTATVTVKSGKCLVNRSKGRAELFTENLGDGVNLEMVAIPRGQFLMGSPASEANRDSDESPQHTVKIQPFFMGKFPVTQAQWRVVAGWDKVNIDLKSDPSRFTGNNRPVERVSWDDAVEFCARLSRKTNRIYRLPSEAEWEYACRAGTTTPFYFGETITPELANYDGNSTYGAGSKGEYRQQTTDVGIFPANLFGLYDLHGNIWEWCQDEWHDNYNGAPNDGSAWVSDNDNRKRLLRGGSWSYNPWSCRSAYRGWIARVGWYDHVGFRVVISVLRT
ncbi:SUMF1/EgtB/PvdO family nonheme iron enzyme [Nostoc sp. UHCC 0870]|uniref:SUMF1/EgtB/PvdO family nonheme iron enzyme n=1 Tax=Nostoc sp. UHCC 0870 TaxID=2914041 RepID=UPI001EE105F3|nr:SUMF1/EgtB/PvdO family nonheme iron enzyme [Nostoc sp. UHCC 0870]UKO99394.1 SUMF1/EgtB/PvdO family nonheme iron enzyme [Nostoc sp. UHCC 0870]